MRTTPANDLRVTKTLEAIDASFRALMLEKGLAAITVKELSHVRGMSGACQGHHRHVRGVRGTGVLTHR